MSSRGISPKTQKGDDKESSYAPRRKRNNTRKRIIPATRMNTDSTVHKFLIIPFAPTVIAGSLGLFPGSHLQRLFRR
jgi:hypothetical protein